MYAQVEKSKVNKSKVVAQKKLKQKTNSGSQPTTPFLSIADNHNAQSQPSIQKKVISPIDFNSGLLIQLAKGGGVKQPATKKKVATKKKAAGKKNEKAKKREILNLIGTSHLKSSVAKSWISHYATAAGVPPVGKCCVSGCARQATVAAHVKFNIGKGRKSNRYIAPFCQKHNKRPNGTVLGLKEGTQVVGVGPSQNVMPA